MKLKILDCRSHLTVKYYLSNRWQENFLIQLTIQVFLRLNDDPIKFDL